MSAAKSASKKKAWSPVYARHWMVKAATELLEDAIGRGPVRVNAEPECWRRDDVLQSSAGALLWGERIDGVSATRESFIAFLTGPVGWSDVAAEALADRIEELHEQMRADRAARKQEAKSENASETTSASDCDMREVNLPQPGSGDL